MTRRRLSDDIYHDLEQKIMTGEYHIGDKFPAERKLAEFYNTSRIPVREAIKLLAIRGFIKTTRGSGTVIISQGDGSFDMDGIERERKLDSERLLLESIRMRIVIESEAAREAALNRTSDDIKEIQNALFDSINEIRKLKLKKANSFFESDLRFHRSIVNASYNDFLKQCYETLSYSISAHQFWSLKYTTPRDEVVTYHTQIYESVLDGNEGKAYAAMKNHLKRVEMLLSQKASDDRQPQIEDI
ncbi:FCD domain protein [Treponema socranskii subsp. socranskii VPI DR56BR1116 = ATCC 35536]|uniref:FCD domain protein n=1 Tax=Treponema socranskii subsp. socranskii VPI DR56BR1116 = ATCC 35536 TaxID=1125725 RepID=U1GRK8_TRESO|nr:FCD domain-containing protein [Treponema socranskii]ERF60605.1 FCD domain protein [Treponema socranskii subsp. socranskii VPI DR56BR1116 = ATCC 35536]ERK03171.1 FCD domain protein [Treponema socranskii subsp. socranskii VPI DR56BR1116 = ATCC 35536]